MLVSGTLLKNSFDRYQKSKKNDSTEYFNEKYGVWESTTAGVSSSVDFFIFLVALIFFVIEILLIYYAIVLALKCTKPGTSERIAHLSLAIFFTFPYILLSVFFGKCAQEKLSNTNFLMSDLSV